MKWISDFIELIFPRRCLVCGNILSSNEKSLCLNCLIALPVIEDRQKAEIEKLFWGIIPIERATSYIYYRKGSPYNKLLHNLKYKDRPQIGIDIAVNAATAIKESGFFEGIDTIVAVPLSKKKLRKRGYNQCDYIAKGISQVTGIPITKECVARIKPNETQTHKTREERWKNVEGIFKVTDIQKLKDKHILLIDDVLTTGATIASCAKAIIAAGGKVSILTIAYSNNSPI